MKIHCLQHVSFEDLAYIEDWSVQRGYKTSQTFFYTDYCLPEVSEFDLLVILGGPMNIYEEEKYPWLKEEKEFIHQAILAKKKILGICLGAQLIAHVLGAKISQNVYKEIGWFSLKLNKDSFLPQLFENFPSEFTAFHWHGDTFDLPEGAQRFAQSEACLNQAFVYNDRVVGLQFHLEYTEESIHKMLKNCSDELLEAPYIQEIQDILDNFSYIEKTNALMESLLNKLAELP